MFEEALIFLKCSHYFHFSMDHGYFEKYSEKIFFVCLKMTFTPFFIKNKISSIFNVSYVSSYIVWIQTHKIKR